MTSLARIGRLFPRNAAVESVRTRLHFDAAPDDVWQRMLFYEEVPRRPMLLLRLFLPAPVRTEGAKTRVGETIRCTYQDGYLEKRITAVEPPRLIRFEVSLQQLGIEDCISMTGGSYQIEPRPMGAGCELVLTTRYHGFLRPRWLWRPLERFLAHRLHHHILSGMRALATAPSLGRAGGPRGLVDERAPQRPRQQRPEDRSAGDPGPIEPEAAQ
ncbi:MAG TPA: SRPBCC family protein [Myxococcaceae bacterium]|nr:SRPBCC family protein [Myxococcaceae bacterium]